MKIQYILIAIFGLITLSSCTEDVVLLRNGEASCIRCFQATIDGNAWEATTEGAVVSTTIDEIAGTTENTIVISGTSTDNAVFTITFMGDLTEANYTQANASITYTAGGTTYTADSSTANSVLALSIEMFNLEEFNVTGTFSGTLVASDGSTITVTNGRFNEVNYVQTTTTMHNASGMMNVDIDGTGTILNTISVTEVSISDSTVSTVIIRGAASAAADAQYVEIVCPSLSSGMINFMAAAEGVTSATYSNGTTAFAAGANGSITFTSFTPTAINSSSFQFDVDNSGTAIMLTNGNFNITY